jgi:hypothetical protein
VTFNGTIAALTSITANTGAVINGGLWAQNGSVTLDANTMTAPSQLASGGSVIVPGPAAGFQLFYRDLTKYTDNGALYDAWFVMGSIVLVAPGQLAVLKFLEMDLSGRQFQPTVGYLLNEVAGTFTNFVTSPTFDPPSIYGTTGVPQSYSPNRYYLSSTKSLARCRHLQLKVDFGKTPNPDELYNITLFGRLMAEF